MKIKFLLNCRVENGYTPKFIIFIIPEFIIGFIVSLFLGGHVPVSTGGIFINTGPYKQDVLVDFMEKEMKCTLKDAR